MSGRDARKTREERETFEQFLGAYPSFAKDVLEYLPCAADFPDLDVRLSDGTTMGVELGEWIDGQQLASALRGMQADGGAFDPNVALDAVHRIVEHKLGHYGPSARGLWLIVHYSRGLLYNTPFRGLSTRDLGDVARSISESLRGRNVDFARVYLLWAWHTMETELTEILEQAGISHRSGPEAFEVFPEWKPCR